MARILIMEDSLPLAMEWRNLFQLNGYDVVLTHNGEDAVAVLENQHVDLVITDLFVPQGKGGLTVMGKLASMSSNAPPVIAVTGAIGSNEFSSDQNRFLRQANRLGANWAIEKPFLPTELYELAEDLLQSPSDKDSEQEHSSL